MSPSSDTLHYSWEKPQYPWFFFQTSDVPDEFLRGVPSDDTNSDTKVFDVVVGDKVASRAAVLFTSGSLSGLIKLTFGAMDAWFEEEEQIFVHPKDPYKVCASILPSNDSDVKQNDTAGRCSAIRKAYSY